MVSKKEIEMWDVEIKFRVRKGSYEAKTKKQLAQNVLEGIGKNDMNCIEVEEMEVKVK